ncbi:hypothetical protein SAMN05421823_103239 [Catalinimonas alkaloidigena]|uniref:Uncharacterized protein n=1 Tax=Catalinimonas alkaloidigena TaxID=1075417 RepID=A0A1G9DSX9_9BACT|nr:hypothetical protein SAMN05421823_103239 [Catalinimonas alkaloidigena]
MTKLLLSSGFFYACSPELDFLTYRTYQSNLFS